MEWQEILKKEEEKEYYIKLQNFLKQERLQYEIYPREEDVFKAFSLTPFEKVKVVLLGQDPYHNPGQACGLSFSVPQGFLIPPSLQNIYQELHTDLGLPISNNGDLTSWAKQGVLLLNTVLTVRKGQANSHQGKGWEQFTDEIIKSLNNHKTPIVYLLFGNQAKKKAKLIDLNKHYIILASHPSPLSAYRGFFGSQPFSKTNEILANTGQTPIDFSI